MERRELKNNSESVVLNVVFRHLTPFIMLFAVYILIHGHYSPGGGFQAGALLGVMLIFVKMAQGDNVKWDLDVKGSLILSCVGALVCLTLGVSSFVHGGNFLDYGVLPLAETAPEARAMGILIFESGVMLTVAAIVKIIYDLLVE
ncbi:hypothetical protein M1N04_00055 [Peptococcaceae bacterium]|nr:hypothetical protein [Peptococcaceae bacterium]